jgi:hypothetical protein
METAIPQRVVQHCDDTRYILNLHALHNAHLIRYSLPRELWAPIPLQEDRAKFHASIAARLQKSGPEKRAATREKMQATRARKQRLGAQMANDVVGATAGQPSDNTVASAIPGDAAGT